MVCHSHLHDSELPVMSNLWFTKQSSIARLWLRSAFGVVLDCMTGSWQCATQCPPKCKTVAMEANAMFKYPALAGYTVASTRIKVCLWSVRIEINEMVSPRTDPPSSYHSQNGKTIDSNVAIFIHPLATLFIMKTHPQSPRSECKNVQL